MSVLEYAKCKALEDRLPFGLDFEVKPSFPDAPTVKVGGFDIPQFDELLAREAWFFETMSFENGAKTLELQTQLRALARELQKACRFETFAEAVSALLDPTEEIQARKDYTKFMLDNSDKLNKWIELSSLAQDDRALAWMKVGFFLLSRVDGTWTLGKTTALRNSQINEIMAFIIKEANGGIAPEIEEAVEESEGK